MRIAGLFPPRFSFQFLESSSDSMRHPSVGIRFCGQSLRVSVSLCRCAVSLPCMLCNIKLGASGAACHGCCIWQCGWYYAHSRLKRRFHTDTLRGRPPKIRRPLEMWIKISLNQKWFYQYTSSSRREHDVSRIPLQYVFRQTHLSNSLFLYLK